MILLISHPVYENYSGKVRGIFIPSMVLYEIGKIFLKNDRIDHYFNIVQEMESYTIKFRRTLEELYYQSVIEHDRRLQLLQRNNPSVKCVTLCDLDKKVAMKDYTSKSYPIAIFLNKLALKLTPLARKVVIYDRRKPVGPSSTYPTERRNKLTNSDLDIPETIGADILEETTINPRQRWTELYDRSPLFPLIYRSLNERVRTRTGSSKTESAVRRKPLANLREIFIKSYETRVYCRSTMNQVNGNLSSFLIWNTPNQSVSIYPLSRASLCHLTFLCRDVICECNKCTTGCVMNNARKKMCDECFLNRFKQPSFDKMLSYLAGSVAERCTLPTFFVRKNLNEIVQKRSDLDRMVRKPLEVGFEIGKNTEAIIETRNFRPGYFRLRYAGDGNLIRWYDDDTADHDSKTVYKYIHGPAITLCTNIGIVLEWDNVPYYNCPSWPPQAQEWIGRKRSSNWPSEGTVARIVSMGCRVVRNPHDMRYRIHMPTEFRFSFSVAEVILFNTLTCEQRKCFISFKALIKQEIYKLVYKTNQEINLSTYCLKTIFLWACETIPTDQWQTTTGWAECLLNMIDQLWKSLKIKQLRGYFILESNLLEDFMPSQELLNGINDLRKNPLTHAATFIDSMKHFRDSVLSISHEVKILVVKANENFLIEQLRFVQRLVFKTEYTRRITFWRKEAVLRIFAVWCKRNSCDINLAPWQCLTEEMTLFDVVYLDILHGFNVPNDVLLGYVDSERSVELICKLAVCYTNILFEQGNHSFNAECSLHFKTLSMFQHTLEYRYLSMKDILAFVSILLKCEEYEMVIDVLEPAGNEFLLLKEVIYNTEFTCDLFKQRTINEIREILSISMSPPICISLAWCYWYSLCICYKHKQDYEKFRDWFNLCPPTLENSSGYWNELLLLEMYGTELGIEFFITMYKECISIKMGATEEGSTLRREFLGSRKDHMTFIDNTLNLFVSCSNSEMFLSFSDMIDVVSISEKDEHSRIDELPFLETNVARYSRTTADRTYYAQVLIFVGRIDKAVSELEDIIDQEGDYSLSVVIWPKYVYAIGFLDETLSNELINSSAEYVVFPTNLYARYLLVKACSALGWEEQSRYNMDKLTILRKRYSRFKEWKPMLNIMSNICE